MFFSSSQFSHSDLTRHTVCLMSGSWTACHSAWTILWI